MLTQNYSIFTEKLKTVSGKYRVAMVMWSFLPFAVNVIVNFSKATIDSPSEAYTPPDDHNCV